MLNKTFSLYFLFLLISWGSGCFAESIEDKKAIVERIYKKVHSASGAIEIAPTLKFDSEQTAQIAYLQKDSNGKTFIGFEEKAYDICSSLGNRRDDAIAYILGHEISHHLLQHSWSEEFGSSFSVKSLAKQLKKIDHDGYVRFETQADERGGVYCYLAGFDVQGISEQLLRKLYASYQIKESSKYPSLEERIKIAHDQDSIVNTYIRIFETANYAMLVSEYEVAIDCYEFIINQKFNSREIYNNLGIANYYLFLERNEKEAIWYYYPVGIDMNSVFGKTSRSNSPILVGNPVDRDGDGTPDDEDYCPNVPGDKLNRGCPSVGVIKEGPGDSKAGKHGNLLQLKELPSFGKALGAFIRSSEFDKTYTQAFLNQACLYTMMEQFEKASIALSTAMVLAVEQNDTLLINLIKVAEAIRYDKRFHHEKVVRGLDEVEKEILLIRKKKSYATLQDLAANGNVLAQRNLAVIDDNEPTKQEVFSSEIPWEIQNSVLEFIEPISLKIQQAINIDEHTKLTVEIFENCRRYKIPSKDSYLSFTATNDDYTSESLNRIRIGDSLDKLEKAYGKPSFFMTTCQGAIWLYPSERVFFVLDRENTVEKWVIFSIED